MCIRDRKTAGRGHKGQKSRSGVAVRNFEGGQMPIYRKTPKRGFNSLKKINPSGFLEIILGFCLLLFCMRINQINLKRFTHIMCIIIMQNNHKNEYDQKNIIKAPIELSTKDIQIGRGKDRRPTDPVRENTFPGTYSFDGLIDEIKIYDVALSSRQIAKIFKLYDETKTPDLQTRILPTGENRNTFGAYYSNLKFYDNWDNMWRFSDHSDIVVEFDNNPSKFIFWKGVSYIPMLVNERNFWYSNEFNETWSTSGGEGCQEPMSDKQVLYNHVRLLENTPARAVIHYRFPLVDVNKVKANYVNESGWYDVADWYYYIYPDGIAAKVEQLWTSGKRDHEWQESMAIFGPDQHPHDLIERDSGENILFTEPNSNLPVLLKNGRFGEYTEFDGFNKATKLPPEDKPKNPKVTYYNPHELDYLSKETQIFVMKSLRILGFHPDSSRPIGIKIKKPGKAFKFVKYLKCGDVEVECQNDFYKLEDDEKVDLVKKTCLLYTSDAADE